ncbi:sperm-associated antigen 11A [Talpa occidentalis]|uniref:sperm-associated antigen 11A n=1 Tax=Talpa occidentalis TaxID=50954 RepID=UPI00188DEE62|nr:sperm-associated antigen 11A [Talpa occidentalis]
MRLLLRPPLLFCLLQMSSGDVPPGIKDDICLLHHGNCRLFFCHSDEKKTEICSEPWNRSCVPLGGRRRTAASQRPVVLPRPECQLLGAGDVGRGHGRHTQSSIHSLGEPSPGEPAAF